MRTPRFTAALLVPRLSADQSANLTAIERLADAAAAGGAQILLFPEAVLTGLVNNDDPSHDLPLAQTIPGPGTARLGQCAHRHGVWLAFGMLEREDGRLYDAAVLLCPDGTIGLRYRRIQPQWHGRRADPAVYCQGSELSLIDTPFGRLGFLLCGDLFEDTVVSRFAALRPEWLLFPFARCFGDGTLDQQRWDTLEMPEYARRVEATGASALMANYLAGPGLADDHSFGGAHVVSAQGAVLASLPLGVEGALLVDIDTTGGGPPRVATSRRA